MKAQPDAQPGRRYEGMVTGRTLSSPAPPRPTVLVVEDEEAVRELIAIVLDKEDLNVVLAESAEEALTKAATLEKGIDILLTDLKLPSMDGYSLAKVLASRGQLGHVIYMSGLLQTSADGAGNNCRYLPKPFNMETLARLVRDVLGDETMTPHIPEQPPIIFSGETPSELG